MLENRRNRNIILTAILCLILNFATSAQTSEFTFQGRLNDQNLAANGAYDLSFKLYDAANIQVGSSVTRDDVQVVNGIFTVSLDFGAAAFDGSARTIEISVRTGASPGAFTVLSPKQAISSVPYAVLSKKAATADIATNATQLGGANASQYVQTGDSRLTDARNPLPGNPGYIQNTPFRQSSSNFNISGSGVIGGKLSVGSGFQAYKMEVMDPSNTGLRVQTDVPGGTIASFGGFGEFQVDAPGTTGGRFTIRENGNVGIGTAQPQQALQVLGNIQSASPSSNSNAYPRFSLFYSALLNPDMHKWQMYTNGLAWNFSALNDAENAETVWMQVTRTTGINLGRVVFPNSVVALDVLGTSGGNALCINSSNQIARCSSSIRYKQNILDYKPGLELIKKLRPVSFNWKVDNKHDMGLVAEEVAELEPLLASYDSNGRIEGVKYDRVGVVLVNAVKEQQAQIETQAQLIARQQQQIDALAKLVCAANAAADMCTNGGAKP
jgi:hypothetical protein